MHSMGLHSALAIKRQRKRRDEQRRARERRYSQQSNESGLGESNSSFVSPRSSMRGRRRHPSSNVPDAMVENKMMSSVGMLHIGVVFLVLGGFLLGSGLLPDDITSWSQFHTNLWWNELTIAGGCAILLGVFLIVLNRYMAQREEDDLTEYVQRQLTRSRSGHRLVRDVETGALTNKHSAGLARATRTPSDPDVFAERADRGSERDSAVDASLSPLQSPTMRSPPPSAHHHLHCDLEQILEEDGVSERLDHGVDLMAPSPASAFSPAGISPGSGPASPSETRELLHHHGSYHAGHHAVPVHHGRHDSGHGRHDSGHGRHDSGHGHHDGGHGRHDSGHGRHDSGHGRHDSGHGRHDSGHGRHDGGHGHHDGEHGHMPYGHHHQGHHVVAI